MSFRKRNIGISSSTSSLPPSSLSSSPSTPSTLFQTTPATPPPVGIRPSPIDGRPTTSTGTPSLDSILAGHSGFALGTSILIEEEGTTDYAGALLKLYAAEGVVQGHVVHVVGVGEGWGRGLPGVVEGKVRGGGMEGEGGRGVGVAGEKMKIAWRYDRVGGGIGSERRTGSSVSADRTPPNMAEVSVPSTRQAEPAVFCHTFDLAKRLAFPVGTAINYIPIPSQTSPPFIFILQNITNYLSSTPPSTIHRLVVPTILSPALYPPSASHPHNILQFLHALRALLRSYSNRLTALLTLPLSLYPRSSGLVRWMELLSDGVLELTPFPYQLDSLSTSGAATTGEERPQGMLKIHRLPIFHEKGGGGGGSGGLGDDLAFTVSRRKFVIAKFSLPPVEGDEEAQRGAVGGEEEGRRQTKVDLEF
ncbi:PAXNEB-domain-containing protein [Lepidopterella palustris CBS 459.81]|uniref:Elongator complex protein 4 n=1 Tax=Lepidopterella palustris CBS 459.81 TaxID=1314670 RepID=A0A8E2EAH4_9PEZI|nr:PAXNEB-domain-containing protein [Lepidopterella palustris CBS 459.81]